MRRVFSLVFVTTATLAVLVGVGLAWTSSAGGSFQASSGSLSVALDFSNGGYGYIGNAVYPTNSPINVLKGQIKNNTPANPGIAVAATTGSVNVTGASNVACNYGTITGDIVVTNNAPVPPGGVIGDEWYARLTMTTAANNDCQGNTISYDVTVNVTT